MAAARILSLGVILLFLGIELRVVDTFVLNERATRFIESRSRQVTSQDGQNSYDAFSGYDPYWGTPLPSEKQDATSLKSITPPRWIGLSLISVGAVLILTCPCFRS